MSINRDWHLLHSIIELAGFVQEAVAGLTEAEYLANRMARDATCFEVLHIGEAASKLSEAVRSSQPQIPWSKVVALRNLLAHQYPEVDPVRIWQDSIANLPALVAACRAELARLDPPPLPG